MGGEPPPISVVLQLERATWSYLAAFRERADSERKVWQLETMFRFGYTGRCLLE